MKTNRSGDITGYEIRSTATGVLFMAIFGMLWAYTGTMGLQGWGEVTLLLLTAAIGITLVIGGISLIRSSRLIQQQVPALNGKSKKKTMRLFNFIFVGEGIAIGIAISICNITHHIELIPLIIAIIVGIHFFPLASLFRINIYYYSGVLLCLIAILTWLFIPETIHIAGHPIMAFMSVVGFGSAIILWITSLFILRMGKTLLTLAS
ncbi:hypothetical protein [Paenibacillus sp. Marseille-Q4541]|uniref:hypothetical protein n=1 Tax=Paenibacillus sp. Marseille-Q4541 TaxID=2831522 RepID=UPI001BADB772|nr:hypothetical protein [Paenibacillus sp. Marseille-Q4541]